MLRSGLSGLQIGSAAADSNVGEKSKAAVCQCLQRNLQKLPLSSADRQDKPGIVVIVVHTASSSLGHADGNAKLLSLRI